MSRPLEARRQAVAGPLATRRAAAAPLLGPLLVAALMMAWGVILRGPTATYTGPDDQNAFNQHIFSHLGAYSDITSLWFRDQLWRHPAPFFGYNLEYPAGMGLVIWLIGFVNSSVTAYLLATAAVMIICGLLTVWIGRAVPGANLWLLALSPTLPLYIVLNWDMLSVMLTVAALVLFRRDRDGWGAGFLAAAVWTKFFPIVLVPLVLLDRALKRRWRDVWLIGGVFGAATLAINGPVAIQRTADGWQLREAWLHFFRFNQARGSELNFWTFFQGYQLPLELINTLSAVLLAGGVAAIMGLMWLSWQRGATQRDLLLPAALAAIAWFFLINKVYSPQYSLWLAVLLALLAAPPALAVAFAAVDVVYFMSSFVILYLVTSQNPAGGWFYDQALFPSMALREAMILGLIVFAAWRIRYGGPREQLAE